jgi:hypothetical protein
MLSSGIFCRVALVRTDVSEERSASIIRVTRISELKKYIFLRSVCQLLVTANVVPSSPILVTLMMEVLRSSETSVLMTATQGNISEDGILHKHLCLLQLAFDSCSSAYVASCPFCGYLVLQGLYSFLLLLKRRIIDIL